MAAKIKEKEQASPKSDEKRTEDGKKPTETSFKEGLKKKKDEPPIDPGKMRVKVYSPYQVYFDDQASSISAVNDTGPFDILPQHHKFLTLLIPCELVIATEKGEEKIKISRGIMYVKEDRVTVFLDV